MLQQFSLFKPLAEGEARYLIERSTVRFYEPGTVIFNEGEPSLFFALVLDGEIEILKGMGSEYERVIKIVRKGEVIGEMSLLHQERHRTAGARARTLVQMMEIPLDDFEVLLRHNAGLAFELMQVMSRRLMDTENDTIRELQEKNRRLIQSMQDLEEAQEQLIANERLDLELSMARQIQKSMLPDELPSLPGWEVDAHWQPARAVSGDFYDFISLPDGRLALIVGDVTDKGVPAALIMTVTRSMLRSAAALSASPGELLSRLNSLLVPEMPMSMFVTCFIGFLDLTTGVLDFANAGHCLPLYFNGQEVQELRAKGFPLGLMPDQIYTNHQTQLLPGTRLLCYSDGLSEAHNPQGQMFGRESIQTFYASCAGGTASIEDLLKYLEEFRAGYEQEDDITLVCLSRAGDIERDRATPKSD